MENERGCSAGGYLNTGKSWMDSRTPTRDSAKASTQTGSRQRDPASVHTATRRDTGKEGPILSKTLEGKQLADQMPKKRMTVTKNDRPQGFL